MGNKQQNTNINVVHQINYDYNLIIVEMANLFRKPHSILLAFFMRKICFIYFGIVT